MEMRDALAPDANVRYRPLLLKEIEKYVTVHTGYKGLEVTADGILCEDKHGEKQLVIKMQFAKSGDVPDCNS